MTREPDMDTPQPEQLPANLRFLMRLVTVLTATMIIGVITVVALLVIRLNAAGPVLPDQIALPQGGGAVAVTAGQGWYAVVTDDDRIHVFDAETGALRQTVTIEK